jgi:hypothetical protein
MWQIRYFLKKTIKRCIYLLSGRPWSLGYFEYKFNFIIQSIKTGTFHQYLQEGLPIKFGYRLDERVVEYPWVYHHLPNDPGILLDAGSTLNFPEILELEKLKKSKIVIVNLNKEGFCHQRTQNPVSYVYDDLRQSCLRDAYFDTITCISTLEHVGMDNTIHYTHDLSKRESNSDDYLKVMLEFKRVLKPGGSVLITVPFGKGSFGWLQLFNAKMIESLIATFQPSHHTMTFFRYDGKQWTISDAKHCQDSGFNNSQSTGKFDIVSSESVCCILLRN